MDIHQTAGMFKQATQQGISGETLEGQASPRNPEDTFIKSAVGGKAPLTAKDFYAQKTVWGGTMLWSFPAGGVCGKSTLLPDGSLAFRNDDNTIFCIDGKTGEKKWSFEGGENRLVFKGIDHPPWDEPPAADSKGNVYLHDCFTTIYSINGKTGEHTEIDTGEELASSVTSSPDGIVAFGTKEGKICAIDGISGKQVWDFNASGTVRKITYSDILDSFIALDSDTQRVYSLDKKTGKKLWEFSGETAYLKEPLIDRRGNVYISSWNDRTVHVIDGRTGKEVTTLDMSKFPGSLGAFSDGVIYQSGVGNGPPKVTAVEEKTGNALWEADRNDTSLKVFPGEEGTLFLKGWERIYAIDAKTGKDKWVYKSKEIISGVIFGSKDTMIFSEQGTIKALYVSEEAKSIADEMMKEKDAGQPPSVVIEEEYIDIGGVRLPVNTGKT